MSVPPMRAGNFLFRGRETSLVIVQLAPDGRPDTVSYWQPRSAGNDCMRGTYEAGTIVNLIV